MRNKTTALEVAVSATAVPRRTVSPAGRALVIAASMIVFALTGCAAGTEVEKPATTSTYLEQIAESWAEYYAIADPPTVDPVRFIGTEEVDTVHRECLLGAGYPRDSMGLIAVPEGQESAFALAEYTCRMQYPVSEEFAQDWGNDQVRSQYA